MIALCSLYPNVQESGKIFWQDIANQREHMDQVKQKLGITEPYQWRQVPLHDIKAKGKPIFYYI